MLLLAALPPAGKKILSDCRRHHSSLYWTTSRRCPTPRVAKASREAHWLQRANPCSGLHLDLPASKGIAVSRCWSGGECWRAGAPARVATPTCPISCERPVRACPGGGILSRSSNCNSPSSPFSISSSDFAFHNNHSCVVNFFLLWGGRTYLVKMNVVVAVPITH